ncbi:hypothetical protein DOTSEDRAFT_42105 [Dothistroma septosporum NZE10]|uniref:Uncharacterized protein n=1 Tax=Dothistroma septosporum (strain NZE10 / CBS 128990) TaxID=675120 RepID=N1PXN5_DOTSN|nr:hypothetical protein DOTSEDRAFT_42105 [Dothistroma septosporum NZE10]
MMAPGAQMNGHIAPSPTEAEEEELYTQLLQIRDAVVAGTHAQFTLPPAVITQLQASIAAASAVAFVYADAPAASGLVKKSAAFDSDESIYHAQQAYAALPGLQAPIAPSLHSAVPATLKPASSGGLDPIFLEKSDSLVRAESQLKRQRVERELQTQLDQRRHPREKDPGVEGPSPIDVQAILTAGNARTGHVSGLPPPRAASSVSSFDGNDYYSSQVESTVQAFPGHHDASGAPSSFFAQSAVGVKASVRNPLAQPPRNLSTFAQNDGDDDDEYDPEDMDDEYTPPDATTFDDLYADAVDQQQAQEAPDDENDDYEPDEIMQEANVPMPYYQNHQQAQPLPRVPVYSNHLTHIAAPQPNRVSPLAVAKGPNIELELVNGRPEVVHKGRQNQPAAQSRASTASPSANLVAVGNKKHRKKKRKRESEPTGRGKRKQRNAAALSPTSPAHPEPRIKDEPISPPPFANVPEAFPFGHRSPQCRPADIDLVSPRHVQAPAQYMAESPRSGLRYETYAQSTSPAVMTVASPAAHRPVQRDTQDLRRVASLHYAQKPSSPAQRAYSPAPTRTGSKIYGDPRLTQQTMAATEYEPLRYQESATQDNVRYMRADHSCSPPRLQEYQFPHARVSSPMIMPPPTAQPRRIVVDQYGNRYYAAEPAAAPYPTAAASRASMAPVDRRPVELGYERASSRMSTSYYQQPETVQYEPIDNRMAPPPSRRDQPLYVDTNTYPGREYSSRPTEQVRYAQGPASPVHQATPRYETMAPPPVPPAREPKSPAYAPTRSHSVRPEETAPMLATYARQASVAPVQYVRQEAPPSNQAMSIMPGYEHAPQSARAYSHAPPPQPVRYVDQYGREVYPEVRQVPAGGEYRYQ